MTAVSVPAPTADPGGLPRTFLAAAAIVVAALFAYHNSFSGPLVFDDFETITENPSIRKLWPPGGLLSPPPQAGVAGRPFANFTYALNYAISGREVWSYHALNLACHAGAALALFGLVRRTLRLPVLRERFGAVAWPLALAVAGLWALHPVQTAAVNYISQRTELLMSLCYVLTLYCFLRGVERGSRRWQGLAVGACVLGMASKEVMVTAPAMALFFDRTFVAGSWREALRRRWRLHLALAATWIVLAALMLHSPVNERGVGYGMGVSSTSYLYTAARAMLVYARLAVWPDPLVFDHGWPFVRAADAGPYLFGTGALLAVVLTGVWRRPLAAFGPAWFFLILTPSTSFIPIIQQPVAESRMHLPLAGLVALGVLGTHRLLGRRGWIACGLIAVAFALLTVRRNLDYADELSIWSDTIVKRPRNARAHSNLAAALARAGRLDESAVHAGAAVRLQPDSPYAQTNLGAAFLQAGLVEMALPHFQAAIRAQPSMALAHCNLGDTLLMLGRHAEAIEQYQLSLARNPRYLKAHTNLGVALQLSGRLDEAIASGRTAVELSPTSPEANYNFANSLVRAGKLEEALRHFQAAVRYGPEFAGAHYGLGSALVELGRKAEAIPPLETALRLRPNYPEVQRELERARQPR